MRALAFGLLLTGCGPRPIVAGDFVVEIDDDGALQITHALLGPVLEDARFVGGEASADVVMQFGAFRFDGEDRDAVTHGSVGPIHGRKVTPVVVELFDDHDDLLGLLAITGSADRLYLDWSPEAVGAAADASLVSPLAGLSAACGEGAHFMGLGSHAMDVDHVGEAFSLWVQEPGIGKTTDDAVPPGWPLEGAKHATSFPVPAVVRPERAQSLVLETTGRVDVDLCASDPDRFELVAWHPGSLRIVVAARGTALGAIQSVSEHGGLLTLPPPWAFGPWNDAIRGRERVEAVADTLRASGASSTAIWTEDWKGGVDSGFGYHLTGEWSIDDDKYPDAAGLAAELEADGFQWMAYFSPFLMEGTRAWDEAIADGVTIRGADGEPYTWQGATFETTTMVDLTDPAGRAWAAERMQAALDLGFDGWMADFAEWLPVDADIAASDPFREHNAFPLWWQQTNRAVVEGTDAVFFVRSGWLGTSGLVPVVWAGDQRTSFDADDGFPTVIGLGLGLAASGVPVFTHDVAGYQSVGNPGSDKELWFRWAELGAYSPVMRTHHGAYDTDNWQFDSDEETVAHWAAVTREHSRLFPYRYGLAARAAEDGTPMILPVAVGYDTGDWGRVDAWLLGEGMLVAPVLEAGATSRDVDLPDGVRWWTWPELVPATSGPQDAPLDRIPVFVSEGHTIPVFSEPPDTFVDAATVDPVLRTRAAADGERTVYLVGGGGPFTEADGTNYTVRGKPSGAGEVTTTLRSGEVEVAGVTVAVDGPVERAYTFVVVE